MDMESVIRQHHIYDTMIDGVVRIDNAVTSTAAATNCSPNSKMRPSEQQQPVDVNTYEAFTNNNNNNTIMNNHNGWKYGEQQHQQQQYQLLQTYNNSAISMNNVIAIAANSNAIETNGVCSPPTRPLRTPRTYQPQRPQQQQQALPINATAESGVRWMLLILLHFRFDCSMIQTVERRNPRSKHTHTNSF